MIKAGIIGGAGYTAGELIRLLINHPDVDIKFINSSSNALWPTLGRYVQNLQK
jgi:N-acetyl-gamma-glutamyl-phosphate reductase